MSIFQLIFSWPCCRSVGDVIPVWHKTKLPFKVGLRSVATQSYKSDRGENLNPINCHPNCDRKHRPVDTAPHLSKVYAEIKAHSWNGIAYGCSNVYILLPPVNFLCAYFFTFTLYILNPYVTDLCAHFFRPTQPLNESFLLAPLAAKRMSCMGPRHNKHYNHL